MEHLRCKASRIRVVPRAMVTIENRWALFKRMKLVVAEFERRFAVTKHVECRNMSDGSQRQDQFKIFHGRNFFFQKGAHALISAPTGLFYGGMQRTARAIRQLISSTPS